MRILTVLFATLFLMGCPEDTTETTPAEKADTTDAGQVVPADTADVQQAADVQFDAVNVEVKTEED